MRFDLYLYESRSHLPNSWYVNQCGQARDVQNVQYIRNLAITGQMRGLSGKMRFDLYRGDLILGLQI